MTAYDAETDLTANTWLVEIDRGAGAITIGTGTVKEDGVAVDISAAGHVFTGEIRVDPDDDDEVGSFTITKTGTTGEIEIVLAGATRAALSGYYVADIEWVNPDAEEFTLSKITLYVRPDVTP